MTWDLFGNPILTIGATHSKTDAEVVYGLCFQRFIYRKAKITTFPTQLTPLYSLVVNRK